MSYHEIVGNMHVHTVYSDGAGTHRDVAEAAGKAGLDFVIVTDHNVWVEGAEGYYDRALLMVGEEIHDVRRIPQANHLLVYGIGAELATEAADPQRLIDTVNRRGGLCYLAHPIEKSGRIGNDLAAIEWQDWDVTGYVGLEIWNGMSEFKSLLWSKLVALIYAYFPGLGIRRPFPAALRKWDELLLAGRKVAAIGNADAHANTYQMGPLRRVVFPYETLFRWVNTHVLVEHALRGDLEEDRQLILDALRVGRTWVGYDRPASTRGFRFHAQSGANRATVGEELVRAGAVVFEIETPAQGDIRLLRNGKIIAQARGKSLRFTTADLGVYRVEVWRTFRAMRRGWIFSSPIYVC